MTISETDGLKVLVVAAPFLVAATVLLGMWLTSWLERREDRRRARHAVPGE
jgi:hypothetical protein